MYVVIIILTKINNLDFLYTHSFSSFRFFLIKLNFRFRIYVFLDFVIGACEHFFCGKVDSGSIESFDGVYVNEVLLGSVQVLR